jgi:hypothetical protein
MPPFSYLTSSFGIAVQHAVRISERVHQGAPISVFEIDTKVLKLALRYPDEDYLREEWNSDFTDWTLKEQLAGVTEDDEGHRLQGRDQTVVAATCACPPVDGRRIPQAPSQKSSTGDPRGGGHISKPGYSSCHPAGAGLQPRSFPIQ